jgi:hypothetical protein
VWGRLVRFAKRRTKEAGFFVILVAVVLIATEILDRSEAFKKRFPDVVPMLHRFTEYAHFFEASILVLAVAILLGLFVFGLVSWLFGRNRLRVAPRRYGIERLLVLPGEPSGDTYRFRMAQHEGDLTAFVDWSDGEAEIAQRYPELHGPKRRKLYQTWFKIRKEAFLLLERFDRKSHQWNSIALSIMLPLTEHGQKQICEQRLKVVEIGDSRDAVIARDGEASPCFLIDTWIVKPRQILEQRVVREAHEHYGICLLFVHAGVLWDGTQPMTCLVEPDNRTVERVCERLGFVTAATTDGYPLQSLSLPYQGSDALRQREFQLISSNVVALRSWPIVGFRP